jgi:hypothetical protein
MEDLRQKLSELHNVVNEIDTSTERKNQLKGEVITIIKERGLEQKKFSIGNRMIRYKVETHKSLTQGYLYQALKTYFKEDLDTANQLYQYIIENRPEKETETLDIVRKKEQPAE